MIAKALGVAGLVLNMTGAICLWWIVRRGSTIHVGHPRPVPFKPVTCIAEKVGWPLLILGFSILFIATALVP